MSWSVQTFRNSQGTVFTPYYTRLRHIKYQSLSSWAIFLCLHYDYIDRADLPVPCLCFRAQRQTTRFRQRMIYCYSPSACKAGILFLPSEAKKNVGWYPIITLVTWRPALLQHPVHKYARYSTLTDMRGAVPEQVCTAHCRGAALCRYILTECHNQAHATIEKGSFTRHYVGIKRQGWGGMGDISNISLPAHTHKRTHTTPPRPTPMADTFSSA